jgi:hypothetical protein
LIDTGQAGGGRRRAYAMAAASTDEEIADLMTPGKVSDDFKLGRELGT